MVRNGGGRLILPSVIWRIILIWLMGFTSNMCRVHYSHYYHSINTPTNINPNKTSGNQSAEFTNTTKTRSATSTTHNNPNTKKPSLTPTMITKSAQISLKA